MAAIIGDPPKKSWRNKVEGRRKQQVIAKSQRILMRLPLRGNEPRIFKATISEPIHRPRPFLLHPSSSQKAATGKS
ncbi:hypothetical protein [Sphingobium sp. C100]|uniref:hypothetical protein n=1 Tax=Sphingobium sp. C100 TaxID=1207055 RepID=UPI001F1F4A50|nr:hypothetical protein [Sphingobium sp. C100]